VTVCAGGHVGDVLGHVAPVDARRIPLRDSLVTSRAGIGDARARRIRPIDVVAAMTIDADRRGHVTSLQGFGMHAVERPLIVGEVAALAILRHRDPELPCGQELALGVRDLTRIGMTIDARRLAGVSRARDDRGIGEQRFFGGITERHRQGVIPMTLDAFLDGWIRCRLRRRRGLRCDDEKQDER